MADTLPTEMINTFYDLTRVEYESLDKQLRRQIQVIERQAAAAGLISSGNTIFLACEAGANSLSVRSRMAWSLLFKAMKAYGIEINRATGPVFLSELGTQATNSSITVQAIIESCAVFRSGLPNNAKQAGMDIIQQALHHEVARMKAEVQLLVAASENMKPLTPQSRIEINGDGNVVVTGDGNQINAGTSIDSKAAAALADALKTTLDHLTVLPVETPINSAEIKELVEDALAEVKKSKPNKVKAVSAIKGIAETIKFVPDLKAAYDIIKPAAAMAGIYLP
ncbi:hypothetical protein ABLE91_09925 [Aquabacter sp. CN5-332]|uniref:hypothetical protein n=1 Tax=Aquabacter sp. CN5-332 TaxID=3156608 RepID=UPI0032B316A3